MPLLRYYIVMEPAPPEDPSGPAVVAPEEEPERRSTWWEGPAPHEARPQHPNLGHLYAHGQGPRGPAWVETRPLGRTLASLDVELPPETWMQVLRDLAAGLGALHEAGLVHGALAPRSVLLREDTGAAVLLGGGHAPGDPREDLVALLGLVPYDLKLGDVGTVAALQQGLREQAQPALGVKDLVRFDVSVPIPTQPVVWPLRVRTLHDSVDEVAQRLGPDEQEPGLLDPWRHHGRPTDSTTGERTGTIADEPATRPALMASLADLAQGAGLLESQAELTRRPQRPAARVKALIADEPVDLLPGPNAAIIGVGAWGPLAERSVEITAIQTALPGVTSPAEQTSTHGEITEVADEHTVLREETNTVGIPTSRGVLLIALGVVVGLFLAIGLLVLWLQLS